MAKRIDFDAEFEQAAELAKVEKKDLADVTDLIGERKIRQARRVQAMSLRLAGLTYEQIAERLEESPDTVQKMVERSLERTANRKADQMRTLENERLDRLMAAYWPAALRGDTDAGRLILAISDRRARMNGLDAPKQIAISANVRVEMEQALAELQNIVLGEVIEEAADDL